VFRVFRGSQSLNEQEEFARYQASLEPGLAQPALAKLDAIIPEKVVGHAKLVHLMRQTMQFVAQKRSRKRTNFGDKSAEIN